MELIFRVGRATVHREIRALLPFLLEALQGVIKLPDDWKSVEPGFGGTQAIIDCTPHYRERVHPGQELFYRGDRHAHFLTASVTTSNQGQPYHVCIANGHNNDQGMFNFTLRDYVEENNIQILCDRGYSHHLLISPDKVPKESTFSSDDWPKLHAAARSPAEINNALVKNWAFASHVNKQTPEWHAIGLAVVYHLVALVLLFNPSRLYPERVH